MKKIPFTKSLFDFNMRVLDNGTPSSHPTLESLQSKLMFNEIFMSNTNEMFEKYTDMPAVIDEYLKGVNVVTQNIGKIIADFTKMKNITFTRSDSFERRYMMYTELKDCVITTYHQDDDLSRVYFKPNRIYYLSIFNNGTIALSYVDENSHIYRHPMSDDKMYWKTDDCIRDYVNNKLNALDTITLKVTSLMKNSNMITKVEYNGSSESMKKYFGLFGRRALIFRNPFLYTGDISQMIAENIPKRKEVQFKINADPFDLFKRDRIIEFPTESFDTYLDFLENFTHLDTKSIHITLYRIGNDPKLFKILKSAVEAGIKVVANIELYATGEDVNKFWMDELIKAGVEVHTYESGNLKVHSKLTLITMSDGRKIAQIGTGNYNSKTACQYTDLSLFTTNEDICKQVEKVFKVLTTDPNQKFNDKLLVTRYNAREALYKLIDREGNKGSEGYICLKCNSLDDDEIIRRLDDAASNGCEISLLIRGVCTWIPNPEDDVYVKSIIWEKLEHSRVYVFGRYNPDIYLGSLDLITHKLDKRIETMVKVYDAKTVYEITNYMNRYISNTKGTWTMGSDGRYSK